MKVSHSRAGSRGVAIAIALLSTLVLGAERPLAAQATAGPSAEPAPEVTFTKDVAPILQENCQVCHQPGAIGPMSLMTYDDVRRYGRRIARIVAARDMPPYQYDADVGIQKLKEDWRMSDEEIATIVAWVDQGSPEGDPADMPPPVEWPDPAEWRLAERFGPPDIVVRSDPYDVPEMGQDRWWRPVVPTGLTEDRCMMAIETKPSVEGRAVAHHANSSFRVNGESAGRLSEYALGKVGEIVPEGACRRAPANSEVAFDIHYWPNGVEIDDDQVEVGIWLHPEGYEGEYRQSLTLYFLQGGRGYDIPPHGTLMTQGFHSFDTPVRIDSWQPHGHTRLVAMSIEILRANGRKEMVSMVSNWSALWHHSHIYEEDVAPLLDVGDQLILTAWYDNTANNRYNPDPDQWVGIGDRTADEMSHAWIAVTHLDEEGLERLKAQRAARPVSEDGSEGR
ncbi:MAG: cytochrome c [Longimicrobiales bacterium]|nr:cytochrome c [Longimicrobiales bacterium]